MQPNACNQTWIHPVCVASSLHRRVEGWVERMDSGRGEAERKSGVKDTLSMTAGIFGRYSAGCWASNFPKTLYQYTLYIFMNGFWPVCQSSQSLCEGEEIEGSSL